MLRINPQPLASDDDLRAALQNAIALEHATIPPYLTALLTLSGTSGSVAFAREQIMNVLMEEMMHMGLACNILNAIGGHPVIADPGFIPTYPGGLPMGVAGDLMVHLRRYSKALVEDTFMKIEEPEVELDIPVMTPRAEAAARPITIGQFYGAIRARIDGHPELFEGRDPTLQVSGHFFDEPGDIAVTDVASALSAIDTILQQGEGTSKSPLDQQREVAHFYSFQQFSKGMRIVHNATSHFTVSFDPEQPISIDDDADVIQMVDDPPDVTYDVADAHAEELSAKTDALYSEVLRDLHRGYNGEPDAVFEAETKMRGFARAARNLLKVRLTAGPFAGQFAGPRFRFMA
jgi:Ferritin-like